MTNNQIGGSEMRELASLIQQKIPGLGFALFVFEFHSPGVANYISNANRMDMIKSMEETLERFKSGNTFPTPERN